MTTGKLVVFRSSNRARSTNESQILFVRGPTRRNAALSHASSPCRSSRTISKNIRRYSADPLATGSRTASQLNTLQTVALLSHPYAAEERKKVKPHGLLVPVSLTPRGASTPGLSTWSSTRSLQRSCDLGDLISWRVSRLDAFSISPIRT